MSSYLRGFINKPLDPYCNACQTRKPAHDKDECRRTLVKALDRSNREIASIVRRLKKLEDTKET